MADRNPVFETMRRYDKVEVCLNRELSTRNSINHNQRGQNVLSCDGNVQFLKTRHVGVPQDDIFTVQNVDVYRGSERTLLASGLSLLGTSIPTKSFCLHHRSGSGDWSELTKHSIIKAYENL